MSTPKTLQPVPSELTTYDAGAPAGAGDPRPVAPARGRHWTDWVGFVGMLAFALRIVLRSGSVGLMLLPAMVHDALAAFVFLIRGRARRTVGWRSQITAYAAAFVFPAFVSAASTWRPQWLAPVSSPLLFKTGIVLWLFGSVVSLWPLWRLRTAFSIAPQARDLVTSGPYGLARHPLYSLYLLQYGGVLLSHPTVPLALAFAAWLALILVRIRAEERVLTAEFPAYHEYRRRVGAFAPRLRRAPAESNDSPMDGL